MGSVASDVGNFVSDTVSSVGDIGQSIIDEGSNIVESVGSGISDATQSVSDAFAQIDPGPAIGDAGAAVDQVVNDVIPGGWYMVAAVAATIATAGTVNLEGEALAAGTAGEVVAATTAAEAAATGVAAAEGVAAASATTAAAASGSTAAQAALQAAATGALKGAAIGAAKSAIMGGDILDGAVNGAITGAVGGGIGNYASGLSAGTDFADYAKTIGAVAGGTAGGATGAALNGGDIGTGALIGGISGGTSSIASNMMPTDVNPAVTSGILGAAKAAITGGDPLLGGLSAAGSSLIGQGLNTGYDAVKSGLDTITTPSTEPAPTQTAEATPEEDYYKQFLAAFENPQLSDQPGYAPVAANDGSSVTVTQMDDSGGASTPLVLQPTVDQLKEYLKQDVDKGLITQEQADAELNKALNSDQTVASSIDTLFYGNEAPKTLFDVPSQSTATTGSQEPTTGNLPSTSDTSGSGTVADSTGTGNTTAGDGSGSGTGGTGTGNGSGTGSGGGTGSGISMGGLGTSGMGYMTTTRPSYAQDVTAGLVNLQPGLTKPMDYDLAGLSNFATGGSTTTKSSLFNDKGDYNYNNLSDSPLTAALTKHNVGYTLTGLPGKADGGLMGNIADAGQFGTSGNFGTNDRVPSEQTMPQPQFFSEGGASMANRYVTGNGDGTSDSIPAMLANGEFVIPADIVSSLGNGSNDSGAKVLDEFLRVIREHKKKHDVRRLPPDSKGPLSYLTDAKRKVRK
jgi:hypothetical protein